MAILILNQFPAMYSNYAEWLKESGEDLFLFTTCESGHSTEGYKLVRTFNNFGLNSMVDAEALKLFEEVHYHTILAFDEEDIIRAARLREHLNIEGQNVASAMAFRDKVVMKTLASAQGILCPAFKKVTSILDLQLLIKEHGFPIILKPIDGMASIDVKVVHSQAELDLLYERGLPQGYMAEQYLKAQMYHIDGIVAGGKLVFTSSGAYTKNLSDYRDSNDNFCFIHSPKDPIHTRLCDFVTLVLKALPTPNTTSFHCEVFHTANDQLLLCEIGSRPPGPGARLTQCILASYGIDPIEEITKLQAMDKYSMLNYAFAQHSAVYMLMKRDGQLSKLMDNIPFVWINEYYPRVKEGAFFNTAGSCVDIIASVVFTGDSMDQLYCNYEQLVQYTSQNVLWNPGKKEEERLLEYYI